MPNPDALVQFCFGMVAVDEATKTIGLVHHSVYSFPFTDKISEKDIILDIART
jgi:hypothetical protein